MSRKQYGLIGKGIGYSFSRKYFTDRFDMDDASNCSYSNFDISNINEFPEVLESQPELVGLNVTIPYKETIIPFLDKLSPKAARIGAVNVIRFTKNGKLKGYNSDYYGFKKSLKPLLRSHHRNALILGTGGASKAVAFALESMGIPYAFVSREPSENAIAYRDLDSAAFEHYQIIINCTPLGTSPDIGEFPPVPYEFFTARHIAFDLIYNPEETEFLIRAKRKGAVIKNGMDMLVFQAEKAWKIWNP